MTKFTRIILVVIIIVGLFLRVYKVGSNPPGLTWDEAALGYNAYSLLQTGRDEYGSLLPINLKSFGDFKPALYSYLDIPFIAAFGLNETAVRLPSVLSGVLAIWLVFLITQYLFNNQKLSLAASLMMAISPYSLQFSRAAFEANVALTLNLAATYLFLKGLKNSWYLIISAFLFGLSLMTYQASRLFIPLIVLATYLIYKDQFKWTKSAILSVIILGLFGLFIFGLTLFGGQSNRLVSQNLFAYRRSSDQIELISNEDGLDQSNPIFQILHGEWWSFTSTIFERYLIYFSPKMLIIDGDYSPRQSVPDLGVLYYFSLLLIPLGIYYLLKTEGKKSRLIFVWLFLASIPAVLSRDLIQTLRALNLVFGYTVLEGAGLYLVWRWTSQKSFYLKMLIFSVLILMIGYNLLIYFDRYYVHFPKEQGKDWLSGYAQTVQEVKTLSQTKQYDHIIFTDFYGQPYIYYLFYTKYPPQKFQPQALLDQPTVDVGTVRRIDNLEFRHVYWPSDRGTKNSLFIGTLDELPDQDVVPYKEFHILKDIKFENGETAFRVVETQP